MKLSFSQIARLAKTLELSTCKNIPSKLDIGGKSELEQFEDQLGDQGKSTTENTEDIEQNDEEGGEVEGMLC